MADILNIVIFTKDTDNGIKILWHLCQS